MAAPEKEVAGLDKKVAGLEEKCTLNTANLPIDFLGFAGLLALDTTRAYDYGIAVFKCPCSNCRKAVGIFERLKKSQ